MERFGWSNIENNRREYMDENGDIVPRDLSVDDGEFGDVPVYDEAELQFERATSGLGPDTLAAINQLVDEIKTELARAEHYQKLGYTEKQKRALNQAQTITKSSLFRVLMQYENKQVLADNYTKIQAELRDYTGLTAALGQLEPPAAQTKPHEPYTDGKMLAAGPDR